MHTQDIILTNYDFMFDRIFEVSLNIDVCLPARNHLAYRTNFQQHPLEFIQTIAFKDCFAVPYIDFVQLTHREFMSQLGQTSLADICRRGMDQFECNEDLRDDALLNMADSIEYLGFINWKWI